MSSSHILTFIGFFFAGLALNLTPCVYPMLAVTASLFKPKKDVGQTLRHSFTKALSYFLGIAVMYSGLGYFAASTGKIFGAFLQNSWVLGAVAVTMFALALSMFGLFPLRAPTEILNRLGALRKANYVGLFASGMLVGVFAAPCIGPPVLALLAAVADNGNPQFGLLAFFVFSLGLGLPYLLLGTFSSLIGQLPKAGRWLIWVERALAVVLVALGMLYLSLALHWHLPTSAKQVIWQPYSDQALQTAQSRHQGVIIDFYAEWCIGCHEIDQRVFSNPKIKAELSQVTTLRVDATDIETPQVQAVIDKYGVIGLPTVVFLDGNGREIKQARVEGAGSLKEFNRSLKLWAQQTGVSFKSQPGE